MTDVQVADLEIAKIVVINRDNMLIKDIGLLYSNGLIVKPAMYFVLGVISTCIIVGAMFGSNLASAEAKENLAKK